MKALADLKEAHKKEDLGTIDQKTEALNNAWKEASEEMYKASQQAGAQPGPEASQNAEQSSGNKDDGEVTDVDFEEVK